MDKLDLIFKKQKALQKKMKYELSWQEHININVLAANVELAEMLQESNFRPWKKEKEINLIKFKEEYIDAIHFIINIGLLLNMNSDELCKLYLEKNEVNHQRQRIGY